jgi:hypothetical protein
VPPILKGVLVLAAVAFYVVLSAVIAFNMARTRGRNGYGWAFCSVVIGLPVVALVLWYEGDLRSSDRHNE